MKVPAYCRHIDQEAGCLSCVYQLGLAEGTRRHLPPVGAFYLDARAEKRLRHLTGHVGDANVRLRALIDDAWDDLYGEHERHDLGEHTVGNDHGSPWVAAPDPSLIHLPPGRYRVWARRIPGGFKDRMSQWFEDRTGQYWTPELVDKFLDEFDLIERRDI